MTPYELSNNPEYFPYRRLNGDKHFYFARYANGDFFQSSANSKTVFFKSEEELLKHIRYHCKNLWDQYHKEIDNASNLEEFYQDFINASLTFHTI